MADENVTPRARPNLKDLTGQRFGRLEVIRRAPNDPKGNAYWVCQCDCGMERTVWTVSLRRGATKSCGCLNLEARRGRARHGHNRVGQATPIYRAWAAMNDRCYNQNHPYFSYYGGRGITVCQEWRASFEAFLIDMGPRSDGLTLERLDNSRGYEKSNCAWVTRSAQLANTRRSHRVQFNGEEMCLKEFAGRLGLRGGSTYSSLRRYIKLGYTPLAAAARIAEYRRRMRATQ